MGESDYIISMFIDDELSLDEKVEFVTKCREQDAFAAESLALLEQEKLLRSETPPPVSRLEGAPRTAKAFRFPRPATLIAAALALAVIGLSGALWRRQAAAVPGQVRIAAATHRFVLYEPSAGQVEIAGSFTGWEKVELQPLRESGYWEITLDIPPGDHSYAYILDGSRKIADPTVPVSESDDFGGQNSILVTGQEL